MCLASFSLHPAPSVLLLLSANRDEEHSRPSETLHYWPSEGFFAGKDLVHGGTWLAASAEGRVALVTNFRTGQKSQEQSKRSRGELPARFVSSKLSVENFLNKVDADAYRPFNLFLFDGKVASLFSSVDESIIRLDSGVSSVSNGLPKDKWYKMRTVEHSLRKHGKDSAKFSSVHRNLEADFVSTQRADIGELPSTGVSQEIEHFLSAPFLISEQYGTRCHTSLMLTDHSLHISETSFRPDGTIRGSAIVCCSR